MPVSVPPDREPLNNQTVWQHSLNEDAIGRILEQVDLPLLEGVSPQAFGWHLNFHISGALARTIGTHPVQARAEIEELRGCIQTYFRLRSRFRELGLDLPQPLDPRDSWPGFLMDWLQGLEQILETPSQGGRYAKVLTSFVVPGLLGLFQAAFGQRPTSTTGRHTKHGKQQQGGPAARFIKAVTNEVRCAIEDIEFDPAVYGPDRRGELTRQWYIGTPDQLEQMIRRGLHQPRPAREPELEKGIDYAPECLEWEVWEQFFRPQLLARRRG